MKYTFVVEFSGKHAFTDIEKGIRKIIGRNVNGSGFSLLSGTRDIGGGFNLESTRTAKIEKLKEFGRANKVKMKFYLYENEN